MSAEVASECRLGEGDQNKPRSPDEQQQQEEQERAPKLEAKHPKVESKPPKQGPMDAKVEGLSKNTTSHKENDQSVASNNAEIDKKKVTEAPPPKVNPWTKNNNPPCPPHNSTNTTQETGMFSFLSSPRAFSFYTFNPRCIIMIHVSVYYMTGFSRFGKPLAQTRLTTQPSC